MGLLDKLTQGGSPYSITGNGQTPSTNVGATQQSKLHADGQTAGYSLNGNFGQEVNSAYVSYVDGMPNILPQPSQLDLNGGYPGYGRYKDNSPEGATF